MQFFQRPAPERSAPCAAVAPYQPAWMSLRSVTGCRSSLGQNVTAACHFGGRDLARRLAERRIRLDLTEPARRFIAESGYDPVYGARPLKRFLQHQLETRIGRAIVAGEVADGSTLTVAMKDDELAITSAPAKL
jgi:hypothetical protein